VIIILVVTVTICHLWNCSLVRGTFAVEETAASFTVAAEYQGTR